MTLVLVAILVSVILYIKYREGFFSFIPFFVLFTSFLYPYITDVNSTIQPETNSATIVLKLFTNILIPFVCLKIIYRAKSISLSSSIIIFISYVFLLSLFSSDVFSSWTRLAIVCSNFLMLPAAIIFFHLESNRRFFYKSVIIINILAVMYVVYCSIFDIGFAVYGNEILRYGGFHFFGLYLFVFSIPLFLNRIFKEVNYLLIFLIGLEVCILVFSLKRTFLLFLGVFLIAFIFMQLFQRRNRFSGFIILGILFVVSFYFRNYIFETQSTRGKDFSEDTIESEGRYLEYLVYFDERFREFSAATIFGSNPFNNEGEFGENNRYGLNTRDRSLHSDYVIYLYGAGVLGVLLLIFIYFRIFATLNWIRGKLRLLRLDHSNLVLAYTYVLILLISQSIDGLYFFWARGFPFLILGYLIESDVDAIGKRLSSIPHCNS